MKDVRKLVADPKWQQILVDVEQGTANAALVTSGLAETSANVALASKNLPQIAESLAKIAKTSAKLSKIMILARIIGLLSPLIP